MSKYLVKIGFDNGNAESGPIMSCAEELVEATSKKDAERIIDNRYGYGRNESYCGCSASIASKDDIDRIEEQLRIADEEYKFLVEKGWITPEMDEVASPYEETEKRRDHLMELADKVNLFNKWWISKEDEVLIDTNGMNDEDTIKYMEEYRDKQYAME